MTSALRRKLSTTTLLLGAAVIAAPAWAHDGGAAQIPVENVTPAEPETRTQQAGPEEIVVTGSSIPRRDIEGPCLS